MNQYRVAGIILVATSLGFVAVFSYLAAAFGYPEVLDGPAASVLPALAAGGAKMRWAWAIYASLPSGIALTAVLTAPLLRQAGETTARMGMVSALTATVAMTAGLMRWPTIHHALAQRFLGAGAEERQLLSALFDAANLYLGNVTGEFIGELSLSAWFACTSYALAQAAGLQRWVSYAGLFTAVSMTVGAFRNLTVLVAPIAALNNTLLPLWLVALGVCFVRFRVQAASQSPCASSRVAGARSARRA